MRLSIITVCLNSKTFLEKTLLSVLSQTWKDFEYIIVDGLSTDGTLDMLEKHKDAIQKVISEKDNGIYNAQNKGIKIAQGDYLLFLNAGDVFTDSTVLEKIFEKKPVEDLFYCDILLEKGGKIIGQKLYPDILEKSYWQNDFLCHQAVFHGRQVFDKFGFYNETFRYVSDHEMLFKVWSDPAATVRHIPVISVAYNMDGVSSDPKVRSKVYSEYRQILRQYFDLDLNPNHLSLRHLYRFFRSQVSTLCSSLMTLHKASKISEGTRAAGDQDSATVLLLNTSDSYGGAARATQRIKQSLTGGRFNIFLAVKYCSIANFKTLAIPTKPIFLLFIPFLRLLRLKFLLMRSFRTQNPILHSPAYVSKLNTKRVIRQINPDLVHLNWLGNNLLTVEEIGKIKKPVVWTFHDMWPFCGAEHVSCDDRFTEGYNHNNRPATEAGFDLNKWVWERKMKSFRRLRDLRIVCPSKWLAECAAKSEIFRGRDIDVIPNGLDTNTFQPTNRTETRASLDLPVDKITLLFGALDSTTEQNKGYHLLMATLNILSSSDMADRLQLVVFGNTTALPPDLKGIPIRGFGTIWDDNLLARLYSAANATVVPSILESFGQTASESLSCGTPVACFDTSGLKSVVDHMENGYRAMCYSPEDLAAGIQWICADPVRYGKLAVAARRKAEEEFSLEKLAANYARIYDELLSGTSHP